MIEFSTKTVIVTGASQGIGAAVGRHPASLGSTVVLAARSADRIEALVKKIPERSPATGHPAVWELGDHAKPNIT